MVFYFAYGSNMSLPRIRKRVPSVAKIGHAKLCGYSLAFDKVSKDGSGKCNVVATGVAQDFVHGVLYSLEDAELTLLDRAEGAGQGYIRRASVVQMPTGEERIAECYFATNVDRSLTPFTWYVEHVLHGAKEAGLPKDYIHWIANVPSQIDPDIARHTEQLSIYKQS